MGKKFLGLGGTDHFWDRAKAWILRQITSAVAAKIAEIVANAPEDLDTLKEIADWISAHANDAAAMNTQIQTNKDNIAANSSSISAMNTQITENKNNIAANSSSISAMNTAILANTEAINSKADIVDTAIEINSTWSSKKISADLANIADKLEKNVKFDVDDLNTAYVPNKSITVRTNKNTKNLPPSSMVNFLVTSFAYVEGQHYRITQYCYENSENLLYSMYVRRGVSNAGESSITWSAWEQLVTMDKLTPEVGFITGNLLSSVITGSNLYYLKFGDGRIFINGWVKSNAVSVRTKLFTLPNDWKASSNYLLPCYVDQSNIACACMINITEGDVYAYTPIPATNELRFCGTIYLM